MDVLLLIVGLTTLIVGGEFLVKGAVGIAKKFGIPSLVIGMTVVSFGTSAPELLVSVNAAVTGSPEIAIGNVIGSNIANLALVLGLTVLIFPLKVDRNSKWIDWPMMMLASILFYLFSYDQMVEWWEGLILFALLLGFIFWLINNSRKNKTDTPSEYPGNLSKAFGFLIIGLVGLYFGSDWLLDGAVGLAESAGMEKHVIGVTIVAFGTSVPELVTSCVAAFKKETDISIGNLIGSNIFNIMAVIGLTSMIKEIEVEQSVIQSDMIWVLAIAAALLPIMAIGKKVNRFKGILLFAAYITYILTLLIGGTS